MVWGILVSFLSFGDILVIFRFRGYFGHFLGFRGIFWVLGISWSFFGFGSILVIF